MTLRQLYYFKDIAELEHYTLAAKKSLVSQSGLSHAIKDLEEELNVTLFFKHGRNVKLTKYGQIFLPYVQQTLETIETGVAKLTDSIHPDTGTVSIASSPSLSPLVSDMVIRYMSETGRVGVHLQFSQEATHDQLCEQLLSGKADLVFSSKINDDRTESFSIGTHPLVLLVPAGHRLASRCAADLRELDGEKFISFDHNCQLRGAIDRIFQSLDVHPVITAETAQDLIIHGLVAAGHGVAVVPCPLDGTPYNTRILSITNDIPQRELCLIWNKNQYLSPAAEYFRDYIVQSIQTFPTLLPPRGA